MSEELYQETLLDHMRSPRNRRELTAEEVNAQGRNPLCGDTIRLSLHWQNERLDRVVWDGDACGVCSASASMMSGLVQGETCSELKKMVSGVVMWLSHGDAPMPGQEAEWPILGSVRGFPMRTRCATLPWTVLLEALGEEKP